MLETVRHIPNTTDNFFGELINALPQVWISEFLLKPDFNNSKNPNFCIRLDSLGRKRFNPLSFSTLLGDFSIIRAELHILGSSYPRIHPKDNWALLLLSKYNLNPKNFTQLNKLNSTRIHKGANLVIPNTFNPDQAARLLNWFKDYENLYNQPQEPLNPFSQGSVKIKEVYYEDDSFRPKTGG